MDFTGSDWCGWCKKLKAEVFDMPQFATWAGKRMVLLEVDFPERKPQSDAEKEQNQKLMTQYNIEGYPTIVVTDPSGKELARIGYAEGGADVWTKAADDALPAK